MDIKLTNSAIRRFLKTEISPEEFAEKISLCGPTFDRLYKKGGDYVFEIEAITNRVDTACAYGVAREGNAILNQMGIPTELVGNPYEQQINAHESLPKIFNIKISDPGLAPRFTAVSLKNVKIGKSDKDVSTLLELCGERPINNAVDITNELTMLYGCPLHIFDLDKIEKKHLILRESKSGETITLLDGSKNKLSGGDIIIEDGGGKLIDLCGVMGGKKAEVDENTKNILLIVPMYHPRKIRKTSLFLQKRTIASQIYEKQPDIELCLPILSKAIELFGQRCSATPSSKIFDFYPDKLSTKVIDLDLIWLDGFVGVQIERESVLDILSDLGFSGTFKGENILTCSVPSWRHYDLNIREDLAEEVARVYGYFRLPPVLPNVNLSTQEPNKLLTTELKIKKYLAALGYSEVFNNSLISKDLIDKTSQLEKDHFKLTNALSADFEYLRVSLLPSLLQNLKNNIGKTDLPISIFELSNIYLKQKESSLPDERSTLSLVTTDNFLRAKGSIEALFHHLNAPNIKISPLSKENIFLQKQRSAQIEIGDKIVGVIGEVNKSISHKLDLKTTPVMTELDLPLLLSAILPGYSYQPISQYPSIIEEITIESKKLVGDLLQSIKESDRLITNVTYLGSFKSKHSFRICFTSQEKNLDQKSVEVIKDRLIRLA